MEKSENDTIEKEKVIQTNMLQWPEEAKKMLRDSFIQFAESLPNCLDENDYDLDTPIDKMLKDIYSVSYKTFVAKWYVFSLESFNMLISLDEEGKYGNLFFKGAATCYFQMQQFEKAVEYYTLATEINQEDPMPFYHMAQYYIWSEQYSKAICALESIITLSKMKPCYLEIVNMSKLRLNELRKQQDISVTKNNLFAIYNKFKIDAYDMKEDIRILNDTLEYLIQTYMFEFSEGDQEIVRISCTKYYIEKSITEITKAHENGCNTENIKLENDLYAKAYNFYKSGDFNKSRDVFQILRPLNIFDIRFAKGTAASYHMLGNYKMAICGYECATQIDREDPLLYWYLCECYEKNQQQLEAAYALQSVIERANKNPCYLEIGDKAKLKLKEMRKNYPASITKDDLAA